MADKTNTIFRALDRKAAAITEFTMRQYRTKISTWVVLVTGMIVICLLMLFYVDAMQRDFEAIDNDGDSDSSDKYLKKRRMAIKKAMKKEAAHKEKECSLHRCPQIR